MNSPTVPIPQVVPYPPPSAGPVSASPAASRDWLAEALEIADGCRQEPVQIEHLRAVIEWGAACEQGLIETLEAAGL